MNANWIKLGCVVLAASAGAGGCGEVARTGRAPVQIVLEVLEAASGAQPEEFGGTLFSDVITVVQRTVGGQQVDSPTVFSDVGRVRMRLILKDQGHPNLTAPTPSPLNQVTITRYRVVYRRADGRNTPGVDVPFPFDSALTFTIPADSFIQAGFEIVRHTAKQESPLRELGAGGVNIATIAEVTFWGRDQTGNEISVSGQIGIVFANFGDPT